MSRPSEVQRVENLRSIPLFAELDDSALRSILDSATEFEAPAGQVLAQPNQIGAGLFVIEEGTVVVDLRDRQVELGDGEFFGELALLDPRAVHVARVRTKTRCRCLAISRDEFERLLEAEPKIAIAMLGTVARRLADSAAVTH